MKQILVIEDDMEVNELLQTILEDTYEVTSAFSGTEALLLANQQRFDIILLDMMLPGMSGDKVLVSLREKITTPIIMLTAMSDKKVISETLLHGADDYLTKPFDIDELLARITVQLRKSNNDTQEVESVIEYKEITLDLSSFHICSNQAVVDLSKKETEILKLLIKNPNKVYTKEDIYSLVWEDIYYGDENTVNVHISNLRKKIAKLDNKNNYIDTVWGVGIKLSQ